MAVVPEASTAPKAASEKRDTSPAPSGAGPAPNVGGGGRGRANLAGMDYREGRAALKPKPVLSPKKVASAQRFYARNARRYPEPVVRKITSAVGRGGAAALDEDAIQAVGGYQERETLRIDGKAGKKTLRSMFGTDIRKTSGPAQGPPGTPAVKKDEDEAKDSGAGAARPALPAEAPNNTPTPAEAAQESVTPVVSASPVAVKAASKPSVTKPLNKKAAFKAYEDARGRGLAVAWVSALEQGLGLSVSGAVSLGLVQAVAAHEKANGRKPKGRLNPRTRKRLQAEVPGLAGIAAFQTKPQAGTANERHGDRGALEEEAVKNLHIAPSYSAYLSKLSKMRFLGKSVKVHPQFGARLKNAEAYLMKKTGLKTGKQIAKKYGIRRFSHLRKSTAHRSESHHGVGFAIDINPAANDWNFGNKRQSWITGVMKRVGVLFGEKTIQSARNLAALSYRHTTTEIFEKISESNEALKRYRTFAADTDALKAYLASPACPAAAKKKGLDYWQKHAKRDSERVKRRSKKNDTQSGPAGFMDFNLEVVRAMRDAAGLRWGGSDFGASESGDMMHFDGQTISLARRLFYEKKRLKKERKKK